MLPVTPKHAACNRLLSCYTVAFAGPVLGEGRASTLTGGDKVRASKDASRASCLAVQPDNVALSIARREALLDAFNGLDEDTRADLLELAETIAFNAGPGFQAERRDAREIIGWIYEAMQRNVEAGLEP